MFEHVIGERMPIGVSRLVETIGRISIRPEAGCVPFDFFYLDYARREIYSRELSRARRFRDP